ncbi:MAG: hypothetical protein G01um101419_138 [Parcubacteria group bacterium Gr01-1014_19]|nr:MAG: hypothetical protein G01um101419_138 [Parcubacteria group bacterium Gr01-1014_19]
MDNKNELIAEIQNRLNLIMVVVVLFPTLVSSLFQLANAQAQANKMLLSLSVNAGIYIFSYFLFEARKKTMGLGFLKTINIMSLIGIGTFIFPILLISTNPNGPLTFWNGLFFTASLWGMPIITLVVFCIILTAFITSFQNHDGK